MISLMTRRLAKPGSLSALTQVILLCMRVRGRAAPAHPDIAKVWAQNNDNRRAGARWAATTLLTKPGLPPQISQRYAEEVFWIAIDPATYRSLTLGRGLSPAGFETWIRNYYDKMLLH